MSHIDGEDDSVGYGVRGRSPSGHGVRGLTGVAEPDADVNRVGVYGLSNGIAGVYGKSTRGEGGAGVYGISNNVHSYGVRGSSTFGIGVRGSSDLGRGVWGDSDAYKGVFGSSNSGTGVNGQSNSGSGVSGQGGL